ncbi:MAG: TlpA family protein disulfide reductase [Sphingobacteriales bacterium]|nr:MAG: TlpA family protein disulfide reductase [Sphingobacteriales bacterium]
MKKITILCVMAVLCLNFGALAQTKPDTLKAITIGDSIPASIMQQILKPIAGVKGTEKISLNSYAGKAIILDLWGSWCGTCISRFPHVDSLNKAYSDELQFLLVNTSSRDKDPKEVQAFVKRYLSDKANFSVPFISQSPAFNAVFFARALPHYVWIGKDRKVKAITDWLQVTPANIEKLIANQPLNLPLKLR